MQKKIFIFLFLIQYSLLYSQSLKFQVKPEPNFEILIVGRVVDLSKNRSISNAKIFNADGNKLTVISAEPSYNVYKLVYKGKVQDYALTNDQGIFYISFFSKNEYKYKTSYPKLIIKKEGYIDSTFSVEDFQVLDLSRPVKITEVIETIYPRPNFDFIPFFPLRKIIDYDELISYTLAKNLKSLIVIQENEQGIVETKSYGKLKITNGNANIWKKGQLILYRCNATVSGQEGQKGYAYRIDDDLNLLKLGQFELEKSNIELQKELKIYSEKNSQAEKKHSIFSIHNLFTDKNIYNTREPSFSSLFLLPGINFVNSFFNDSYFKNFIPAEKNYYAPSVQLELVTFATFVRFGLEYRYDYFKTKYKKTDSWTWKEWNEEDKFDTKFSYKLPQNSQIKINTILLTAAVGYRYFYFEFGIGKGKMIFENSPFYFKLNEGIDKNDNISNTFIDEIENDFFFSTESSIDIYSAGINICPNPKWLFRFQVIHNNYNSTRRPAPKSLWLYSDGSMREHQNIDESAAPIMGIITISYRFHLFSWGKDIPM